MTINRIHAQQCAPINPCQDRNAAMLSKILSTATLIVAAWLSMQILHTHKALDATRVSFNSELATIRAEFKAANEHRRTLADDVADLGDEFAVLGTDVLARMDALSAEQAKLAKAAGNKVDPKILKSKNSEIARLKNKAALQGVFATVLEADLASVDKEGERAAELLLSTKQLVWKASGQFPEKKDALRGLMAPIDVLAGKWKRGEFENNTKKIQVVLRGVLDAGK